MKWELVRLGDIVELSNGINFDKSSYQKGIKLINVSNFGNRFTPDYNELLEIKSSCVRESYILKDGDIIFVRSNGNKELVGRCMLIKHPPLPVTYSGFCIRARIIDKQQFDETFLTYHFKSILFRRSMSGTSVGANIQNLSQSRLSNYQFKLPDITIQRKIAKILSAYDNLIENNQKQIKLLEEAAQRLYKEWFVDLRFPGYENVPIIDGVPEGWRKDIIGNLLKKISRTKQIKVSNYQSSGYIPVIDQSREFISGYTNDLESCVDLNVPVIIFGDHTRILKYIQFPFAKGADGTQLIVSYREEMPQPLFYCTLLNVDLSNYHYARHFKYLKEEKILIPSLHIAKQFEESVTPIFQKIQSCRNIIDNSILARDRLLPKLMNGELEV